MCNRLLFVLRQHGEEAGKAHLRMRGRVRESRMLTIATESLVDRVAGPARIKVE